MAGIHYLCSQVVKVNTARVNTCDKLVINTSREHGPCVPCFKLVVSGVHTFQSYVSAKIW